jgi:hypothetical protein
MDSALNGNQQKKPGRREVDLKVLYFTINNTFAIMAKTRSKTE